MNVFDKLKMFFKKKKRAILLFILLVMIVSANAFHMNKNKPKELSYTIFLKQMDEKLVEKIEDVKFNQDENMFTYKIKEKEYEVTFPWGVQNKKELLFEQLKENDKELELIKGNKSFILYLFEFFRIAILIVLIYFIYKMFSGTLSKFDVAEIKDEKAKFDDIAGYRFVKEEMKELVDFLNYPEKYEKFTQKPPKGVLFEGPPGNGKTLFAKAVAGETDTAFFQISASDIEDMYVGSGARRLQKVFKKVKEKAKEKGKAILFIDEIDAVGMKREKRTVIETNQTINKLLTELDGFDKETNVLVIGATNLASVLDDALTRSGRFDRIVTIPKPNRKDRKEVFNLYLEKKRDIIESEVFDENYADVLASQTEGFCNADIDKLINESAIIARKRELEKINIACLRESFTRTVAGVKMEHFLSEEDKKIIAYHESAHAIMQIVTSPYGYRGVAYITITPYGQSLGHVVPVSNPSTLLKKKDLENEIKVMLAGRAVEEKILNGNPTTGAAGDLQQANRKLTSYVKHYGLSEELENYFSEAFDESNKEIQRAVKNIRDRIYKETKSLVDTHFDMIEALAEHLMEHENVDQHELPKILKGTSFDKRLT